MKITITEANGKTLATIDIVEVDQNPDDTCNYSIKFKVNKKSGVGLHQRGIFGFPSKKYNVLALLLQALNTLQEKELRHGEGSSADLARSERGARAALPYEEADSEHYH